MPDSPFIPRRKAGDGEFDFERLRAEAIGLIEQVSGEVWSDYNLHDPGITILEQLIYAITELAYRTDFPVEDYLAQDNGEVGLDAQSLHRPHEIFSCRPTTSSDYRKLLLNALPEIDNLWFDELEPSDDESENRRRVRGLYRLAVKLSHGVGRERRGEIEDEIRRIYRGARNLCEDLEQVRLVENIDYDLCAEIEVSAARDPARILAEIYHGCARRIGGGPTITTYDRIDDHSGSLDQLFDGPYTDRGFFLGEDNSRPGGFPVSTLFAVVNRARDVKQIRKLCLSRSGRDYYDQVPEPGHDQAIDLAIPTEQVRIGVVLTSSGRRLEVPIADFAARYDEIRVRDFASRNTEQELSLLNRPIVASARPLQSYLSIQDQFPAIYGVNRYGVPATAASDVKGRARQLKAYLLIFEQYLVNFLADLDSLDRLFSLQIEPKTSYATGTLDASQVADIDQVYPDQAARAFGEISARFDNFNERKGRLLDYLLALYGERFNQRSLRRFNFYYGKDEVDDVILANKVAFLRDIVELGRDRGAAADFIDAEAAPVSGLARRAARLLAFAQPQWLTGALAQAGLELPAQTELERRLGDRAPPMLEASAIEAGEYTPPATAARAADQPLAILRSRLDDLSPLNERLLSPQLMVNGIDIRNYRVGRDSSDDRFGLYLQLDAKQFWRLGSFDDDQAAARSANGLRQLLLQLNRASEGIHIIEHLMLRPRLASTPGLGDDFYSFRVSAVLPAWTARCRDPDFRKLADETLRLNAPAHLLVETYWLEFDAMRGFEDLYRNWLEAMSDAGAEDRDRHSRALAEFILALQPSVDGQGATAP